MAAFKQALAWSENSLDIVVPAAGIEGTSILDTTLQAGDAQHFAADPPEPPVNCLDVNLKGVHYTANLALFYFFRLSRQQRNTDFKPQLLFISSLAGYEAFPFSADYAAAKFGVRGLWKGIRKNQGCFGGMQTNLLAPSWIETDMIKDLVGWLKRRGATVGTVEDVVDAAMRCICDNEIDGMFSSSTSATPRVCVETCDLWDIGRAICVCAAAPGAAPGSSNFDVCDDPVAYNSGRELLEKITEGRLGKQYN